MHGFVVLSKSAVVAYKCDNVYHKQAEHNVVWNDKNLAIDWQIPVIDIQVSLKDKLAKEFIRCY